MDVIPQSLWLKIAESYGTPTLVIIMIVIFSILIKSYESQWKHLLDSQKSTRASEDEVREKDRLEHIQKWNSMTKEHVEERDRQFKLFLRQTEALELQALMLQRLSDKIDTNQYCPINKRGSNVQ